MAYSVWLISTTRRRNTLRVGSHSCVVLYASDWVEERVLFWSWTEAAPYRLLKTSRAVRESHRTRPDYKIAKDFISRLSKKSGDFISFQFKPCSDWTLSKTKIQEEFEQYWNHLKRIYSSLATIYCIVEFQYIPSIEIRLYKILPLCYVTANFLRFKIGCHATQKIRTLWFQILFW